MADVYGTTQTFDDAKDKLYNLLGLLKTAMSSGYDPTFSYLYNCHTPGKIELNAVTIEFEGATKAVIGGGSAPVMAYQMEFSIRVHTGYVGGFNDNVVNTQLLNSIDNYLSAHLDLGDAYWISKDAEFSGNESFEATVGAQMTIYVIKQIDHIQS